MTDADTFADEIFGFHAQQAVEKALKAWLALLGEEYPRTHDIDLLLSQLQARSEQVEAFSDLLEFNPYAVQLRYEAFDELGEPLDRKYVVERVTALLEQVKRLLNVIDPQSAEIT
jgi:HEPN domain-containing protein